MKVIFKADKIEKPGLVQLQNSIKVVGIKSVEKGMSATHPMIHDQDNADLLYLIYY